MQLYHISSDSHIESHSYFLIWGVSYLSDDGGTREVIAKI